MSGWLLISLFSLVCRLWSKSGLLFFGLLGVICYWLFWCRGIIWLLCRLFSCRCIIWLLRLYWLLQRFIILYCRLCILWLLWVIFWCRSNNWFFCLWIWYRLLGYCRLCRWNINRGNRRCLSYRFNWCSLVLCCCGSSSCYSDRFGNWCIV